MAEKRPRTLHEGVGIRQQQRRRQLINVELQDDLQELVDVHVNEAHQLTEGPVVNELLLFEERIPPHQFDEYENDADGYEEDIDDFQSCFGVVDDDSDLDADYKDLDDFNEMIPPRRTNFRRTTNKIST